MESSPSVDLRQDYDQCGAFSSADCSGTLYRKGAILQAWYDRTVSGYVGSETWTLPDTFLDQAIENYQTMLELFSED